MEHVEIQDKMDKLYSSFDILLSNVIKAYVDSQKQIGPLSTRDEKIITEFKWFLKLKRKYNRDFYDDMFKAWTKGITAPQFIFDEPIDFTLNRDEDFVIEMPVFHEWGLRVEASRIDVMRLEIVLLSIASIFHDDEDMIKDLEERIKELSPRSGKAGGFDASKIQGLMGNMLNSITEMPMFKDQLPEGFNGTEMMNAIINNKAMGDLMEDFKKGDFNMDKCQDIIKDPEMMKMMEKFGGSDGKPTSFAELPPALQPPGAPMEPSEGSSGGSLGENRKEKETLVELD